MNFIKITKFDTANGLGIGTVLWVCGCEHKCYGCHNPQTHDPFNGKLFTSKDFDALISSIKSPQITRLTFSGGDPLFPMNRSEIAKIAKEVKRIFPTKKIWLYTGYEFEQILEFSPKEFLKNIDVIVDGKFILSKKDLTLKYCGSSNQRIIDVKKTLDFKFVMLFDLEKTFIKV